MTRIGKQSGLLLLASFLALTNGSSFGAILEGQSAGYGLSVDVDALSVLSVDVGPLPAGVTGDAPAPYNDAATVLNVLFASSIPFVVSGNVSADAVQGTAFSNVDGLTGSRLTSASGGVVGAGIDVVTLPILGDGITVLGLDGTLSSTAQIAGDYGSLVATGTTVIESLSLEINDIPVDLSAYVGVAVAPNTSVNLAVLGILNTSLILNEQVIAPDQSSITVNALRLNVNLAGLVVGEVILGHSQAQMTGVPEPATWLLLFSTVPAGLVLRRRLYS
jgi:hypothetical protein